MSPVLVEQIATDAGLAALSDEWAELSRQVQPRLPFFEPGWQRAWWRHYRKDTPVVRHSLQLRSFRRPGGELIGVAPLMVTQWPARGPLRLRVVQFLGADPNVTELRGVVCRPEDEADVYGALIAELKRERGEWDAMRFTGVRVEGAGHRLLLAEPDVSLQGLVPDYVLTPGASWERFAAGLHRNLKESLRKGRNAPKRDGVELTLGVVSEPPQLERALEEFFRLHAARAASRDAIVHRDVFRTEAARSVLRDFVRELGARGGVRVFQVLHGQQVVATRVGFVLDDSLFLYFSGYEPDYAKYGVMTTCVAGAIRYAMESGLKNINLSSGNDLSKTRWGPTEVPFANLLWASPAWRSSLVHPVFKALEEARGNPRSQVNQALGWLRSRA